MRDIAVYLGPTLSHDKACSILDAVYLPPVRRGDLEKLDPCIRSVAIIDGEFFQSLAISPKEILPLIERGIRVYGASSMGALRAAELCGEGMIGMGRIFEAYRDGVIDADDEVAVTYDPETYRPLSEPLVSIRFTLEYAVERNLIDRARAREVLERMRHLWFPERSYRLLMHFCPELEPVQAEIRRDRKAEDALMLLGTLCSSE